MHKVSLWTLCIEPSFPLAWMCGRIYGPMQVWSRVIQGFTGLQSFKFKFSRLGGPLHRIHLIRSCSWLERMGKCWEDWEAVATTRNHQLCHIIHDSIQFCCCSHPLASPSQPQEKIKQISASVQIQIHPTRPQWHSSKLRKQREKNRMVPRNGGLLWVA